MDFINEARWDRIARICLGILMILLGWTGLTEGLFAVALRIFGLVPLITGLIGWDPVYALFGFDSRKNARGHRPWQIFARRPIR